MSKFFGGAPSLPPPPPPPPPPPTREDPEIAEAKKRLRQSELKRKGRASLMLTGGEGVTADTLTERPAARAGAQLLGETG